VGSWREAGGSLGGKPWREALEGSLGGKPWREALNKVLQIKKRLVI
jgi:hypothetical protein